MTILLIIQITVPFLISARRTRSAYFYPYIIYPIRTFVKGGGGICCKDVSLLRGNREALRFGTRCVENNQKNPLTMHKTCDKMNEETAARAALISVRKDGCDEN